MIVAARSLKGEKKCFGHRAAGNDEALTHNEVIEPSCPISDVLLRIEHPHRYSFLAWVVRESSRSFPRESRLIYHCSCLPAFRASCAFRKWRIFDCGSSAFYAPPK